MSRKKRIKIESYDHRDSRTIMLTPSLAKTWFDGRRANRTMNRPTIEQYKRDLISGLWKWCGDTIIFNELGEMMDGQHRCLAIIESGVSMEVLVVGKIPDERMHHINRGPKRTPGQIFQLHGMKSGNLTAAIASVAWRYEKSGRRQASWHEHPTIDELEQCESKHSERIRAGIEAAGGRSNGLGGASMWGFLFMLLSEIDEPQAVMFLDRVLMGIELREGDPEMLLRKQLLEAQVKSRYMGRQELASKAIRAWNARREGRKLGTLKWMPEQDDGLPLPK